MKILCFVVVLSSIPVNTNGDSSDLLPVIINTWPFVDANKKAVSTIQDGGSYLDAIEKGCSQCEIDQCDGSVGYGGSPDESSETTLDAMIMDGETHDVGSVGCLRRIKSAISVARSVMKYTSTTLLVGDLATDFAKQMGFEENDLHTTKSKEEWEEWKNNSCQPNYWNPQTVTPDPTKHCGPYKPKNLHHMTSTRNRWSEKETNLLNRQNHDTIGMIVIDKDGKIACGTTTNGLNHKIPGRVGDSPIAGAGCYVEKGIGGAAATGDGDIMMRFLPSYRTVQNMRSGTSPSQAAQESLDHITRYYPNYSGALIAVSINGSYGGATHGFSSFKFTVYNPKLGTSTIITV